MIRRTCKRTECPITFEVRYASDQKEYCSRSCGGKDTAKDRQASRPAPASRLLEFLEGLTDLDKLHTCIRLGHELAVRQMSGDDLGEIGRLTREAFQ